MKKSGSSRSNAAAARRAAAETGEEVHLRTNEDVLEDGQSIQKEVLVFLRIEEFEIFVCEICNK